MVCNLQSHLHERARIADTVHGKKIFELGMFHPAFITFMLILGVGLGVLSGFFSAITMYLHLCMAFAIWVTSLVALRRHRQLKLQSTVTFKGLDAGGYSASSPSVVSHDHLDKVCVFLLTGR